MREKQHHLTIIGQQRPFDEERWRQLLTAFAYVLHEQRQAAATDAADEPTVERNHRTPHTAHTAHIAHAPLPREGEDA